MASVPQYAATPRIGVAQISTANTARDGTGAMETVFVAGSGGSRVDTIKVQATGSTTAGMIRLFIDDGTNNRLWLEIIVFAATPSGYAPAWSFTLTSEFDDDLPLILPSGHSIKAATNNAETFNVFAVGGDF